METAFGAELGGAAVGIERAGGDGDAGVGPGFKSAGGGGLVEVGDGQAQAFALAVDAFAGDVVPVGAGLVVGQQGQAVVEAADGECLALAVDYGRPTDTGVAGASE